MVHYRTVPLMRLMHRIRSKPMCLQLATKAGDGEVWIAQVIAQQVSDCRNNHGKGMTAVYVQLNLWRDE